MTPQPAVAAGPTRDNPFSVEHINTQLSAYISQLPPIWFEGEITKWNLRRGHVFATVKDLKAAATTSIVIWNAANLSFAAGDHVVMYAQANFWKSRGDFNFVVHEIHRAGVGDLLAQLEALKQQLNSEGLFAADRKQALPFLPGCIGLITGANSDAEKDVLQNARLRWPDVNFRVINTAVQGPQTVPEVLAALAELDSDPAVDVIIIARGGGDFNHLLPFSDESLVRAVAAAKTPVVSAIGHEADNPLLDYVADLRASTPTDAAKRVVPDVAEQLLLVSDARGRIHRRITGMLDTETRILQQLRQRPVLSNPQSFIDAATNDLNLLADRCFNAAERTVEQHHAALQHTHGRLLALSPLATLQRGYSVVQRTDGAVVTAAESVKTGDQLLITTAAGKLSATTN
ncbi:exodeoxyribonuclease VII large subunit [Leucobacter sp. OH1287]|uniref:exodeoxyribonuclease VII large subunit n=1 Tax=Leucobacter sp. OH1287 TaxID=2491049 RepID=UPI000F5DA304|nr:exodeoxyribonuclease VII large subunit [Leucobacter sp. OH1287]RRD60456.1 exodeoxyribonuclease VII large subunit [Leucobacter sp. OH1287]